MSRVTLSAIWYWCRWWTLVVRSFYFHANICAVTKPSSMVPKLKYGGSV